MLDLYVPSENIQHQGDKLHAAVSRLAQWGFFLPSAGKVMILLRKEIPKEIENHMKQNRTFIFIMTLLIVLGLSACSSHERTIDAKYVSIFDNSSYLIFDKNGSIKNSLWNVTNNGTTSIADSFIYNIDEDNIITAIDTTEYEGQDSLNEYVIGILYKDYIGHIWNGNLPQNYDDATITDTLGDLFRTYNFREDKSYEYVVISNNETVHNETGTYTINDNEVVCVNEEGLIMTFINAEDKVFCIEYAKE